MKMFLIVVLVIVLLAVLTIYVFQGQLIYHPQRYYSKAEAFEKVDRYSYLSSGRKQFVYVMKRAQTAPPDKVWWFFNGNASVALNWVELLRAVDPEKNHAYVLFDYPGYGINAGRANPDRIRQSVDGAFSVLAEQWGISEEQIASRSSAFGHSLGSAVALDTANRYRMSEVIAISPFTTMKAMAKKQFGGFLAALLSHHYDNERSVRELLARESKVRITIFHGDRDTLIPIAMSEALAAMDESGERIKVHPVPGAGHNGMVPEIRNELLELLNAD
ncbi:alpha/beta hydrolase [Verrucomicrobiales bacterium BCK34]|nr:alpha/beta hydrolase [Verrucomicrobiales bacterium BCK34]